MDNVPNYLRYRGRDKNRPLLPERRENTERFQRLNRVTIKFAREIYQDTGHTKALELIEIYEQAVENEWTQEELFRRQEILEMLDAPDCFPPLVVEWILCYRDKENE